jgi:hypothetical protein
LTHNVYSAKNRTMMKSSIYRALVCVFCILISALFACSRSTEPQQAPPEQKQGPDQSHPPSETQPTTQQKQFPPEIDPTLASMALAPITHQKYYRGEKELFGLEGNGFFSKLAGQFQKTNYAPRTSTIVFRALESSSFVITRGGAKRMV